MIQLNLDNLSGQLEIQVTQHNPDKTWHFLYFFNKFKKYIINLWILRFTYLFFIA